MTRTETNNIVRDLALSPLETLQDVDKEQLIIIQLNSIIALLADVSKSMAVIADRAESEKWINFAEDLMPIIDEAESEV